MADTEYYGLQPSNVRDVEHRYSYVAASAQTIFPAIYGIGSVDVYYNGSHLDPLTAFTATDGITVVLTSPAVSGASVYIVSKRQVLVSENNDSLISSASFTATNLQTLFPLSYTTGSIFMVTKNGLSVPFTASSGTLVVLNSPAALNDLVVIYSSSAFSIANAVAKSGDTMLGPLSLSNGSTAPTQAFNDISTKVATTEYVNIAGDAKYMKLSGSTLTGPLVLHGSDSGVTPPKLDNSTTLATTAFVNGVGGTVGSTRNLKSYVTADSSTKVVTADEVIVETTLGGAPYRVSSINLTGNLAGVGVGGMDTGSAPALGFVAEYLIFNPTTNTSALLYTNSTSVTSTAVYSGSNMPVGYTASALISVWPTNASSQFIMGYQTDRNIRTAVNTLLNTAVPTATITSLSASQYIPRNAVSLSLTLVITTPYGASNPIDFSAYSSSSRIGETSIYGNYFGINTGTTSLPLVVPQTIYYNMPSVSTGQYRLSTTGYSI